MSVTRAWRALVGLSGLVLLAAGAHCSLQNQEGPEVTCEDLQCGRINACSAGIIAQCADGKNVLYHVCFSSDDTVCEADWQVPGQYACDEYATECEGCNPNGAGCVFPTPGPDAGG
jgi:hypothetical protein